MMRLSILMFVSFLFLVSCDNKDVPTVSHLESKVNVSHFDHSFFAMDSTKLGESLGELERGS